MARKKKATKRRSSGGGIKRTADKILNLLAFAGPEAGTILAGGLSLASIAEAASLKTGFNFADGSFDPTRMVRGWGPSIGYNAGKKLVSFVNRLLAGL